MPSARTHHRKKSGSTRSGTPLFPERKSRRSTPAYPSVTLIGCGNWGGTLALALHEAGVPLREIVLRDKRNASPASHSYKRRIARAVGARLTTLGRAALDADVLWICTPDASIPSIAKQLTRALASRDRRQPPVVFHSSGALASEELSDLRTVGASVASVHPLMTFPNLSAPQPGPPHSALAGVPFALEGDVRACRVARRLVHAVKAEAFAMPAESKPLYHAYGAFASPLLVALLAATEHTGAAAGFSPLQARQRMRPIVERTIRNFFANGPKKSFSGPIARGDADTIARHLAALRPYPELYAVYRHLAQFAAASLPAKNKHPIQELLQRPF